MDFEQLEKERQIRLAAYKKRGKIALIIILCGIVAAVGGFFLMKVNANVGKIIMVLGLLAVGVGLILLGSRSTIARRYAKEFKQPLVSTLVSKWYDNGHYEEHGRLPLAEIMNSGLLTRRPDRVHMEDLIEGSYHGVSFRTCDVHLEEEHTYTDSKGNTHTEWITFFRGRWYQFFLNRDMETLIRIKEKKRIKEMITRGLEKVEVESIDFTDKFMAYASDEHQFFYIFTPVVIEKMLELEKIHKGKFMFSLDGNIVNFGIDDNRDYLELNLKTPINEKTIEAYEFQVSIMAAIIKEFKFDTYKFQPQTHKQFMENAIHVDQDDIDDFIEKGTQSIESQLENADNIIEAKLNQIDAADNPDYAAQEIDAIDEELEEVDKAFDKM